MDIKEIRLRNLKSLRDKHGSIAALAEAVGSPESNLGNIIRGEKTPSGKTERGVGYKLARKIEAALELSAGWMDQYHPSGDDERTEKELLENFRRADKDWREHILDAARRAGGPRTPDDPGPGRGELSADPISDAEAVRTPEKKKKSKGRRSSK